jgi:hypothetical protein
MAIIMVQGRQVSRDPEFNAFATARFTRHNSTARAEFSDPSDTSQRISLNPEQYRRVLQAFQAEQRQRANGYVRDQRRFARTGSTALAARPSDPNAPLVLVSGRATRPNPEFANFVLGLLRRSPGYRPLMRDGRMVISLTPTQFERANERYTRHLNAEALRLARQYAHAPHPHRARPAAVRATARNEDGHVTWIADRVITVTGGG